jgi:hypothetical protein
MVHLTGAVYEVLFSLLRNLRLCILRTASSPSDPKNRRPEAEAPVTKSSLATRVRVEEPRLILGLGLEHISEVVEPLCEDMYGML